MPQAPKIWSTKPDNDLLAALGSVSRESWRREEIAVPGLLHRALAPASRDPLTSIGRFSVIALLLTLPTLGGA